MDQEYFLAVIAQITTSPRLMPEIEPGGRIDRMLSNSVGLDERIISQLRVADDGQGVWIEPQEDRITRVVHAAARGLYYVRYGVVADREEFRVVTVGPEQFVLGQLVGALYSERFRGRRWLCFQPGVFEYTFVRAWWAPRLLCVMRFYETVIGAIECRYPSHRARMRGARLFMHGEMATPWRGA